MHPDIAEFRAFYDSRLGVIARKLVRARLRAIWPDVRGQTLLGLGYATPYMAPFVAEAAASIALMPSGQGAAAWPRSGRCKVALVSETDLPIADGSIDRVLMVHGLETSEVWRSLLRQVWRILRPDGRLMVVAPNRTGLWAASGNSPFGHGHPYTRGQLERLLADAMFAPERWDGVLYGPPWRSAAIMRTGRNWERTGRLLYRGLPGLIVAEASKAMSAPARTGHGQRVPARAFAQRAT
jgi:SAM-dependent methyltransferase